MAVERPTFLSLCGRMATSFIFLLIPAISFCYVGGLQFIAGAAFSTEHTFLGAVLNQAGNSFTCFSNTELPRLVEVWELSYLRIAAKPYHGSSGTLNPGKRVG